MTESMKAVRAEFKYTFPVEKSFTGEDGRLRLVGSATGPEVDLENQRVDPALVKSWADRINRGEMPLVYRDQHRRDTAIEDLGVIEKAWVDENDHLVVQVLLDEDNPVSQYIHKAAAKGKQYGMSIHGKVTKYRDEVIDGGRKVITILDGVLDEISHTTRPVWTPSFGTVLSKSVDAALAESEGANSMSENSTETKVDETTEKTDTTGTESEEKIEKSTTEKPKTDDVITQFAALQAQLREAGLLDADGNVVMPKKEEAKTVEKSESTASAENDKFSDLEKSVKTLSDVVLALADKIPDGSAPGVLRKSETADPLAELRGVEDPMERLRLAMAVQHGNDEQR